MGHNARDLPDSACLLVVGYGRSDFAILEGVLLPFSAGRETGAVIRTAGL